MNANEANNQKENMCRALIKAGKIMAPPQLFVPVSPQLQSLSKAKAIKTPHFTVSLLSPRSSLHSVIKDVVSFVGPPDTGKPLG